MYKRIYTFIPFHFSLSLWGEHVILMNLFLLSFNLCFSHFYEDFIQRNSIFRISTLKSPHKKNNTLKNSTREINRTNSLHAPHAS